MRQPQRRAAAAPPQREGTGGAEADDGHHGVLRAAATDGVAMPGDAVGGVAITTQPHRGEGLAELAGVNVVEPSTQPRQERVWWIFAREVVKTHQARGGD